MRPKWILPIAALMSGSALAAQPAGGAPQDQVREQLQGVKTDLGTVRQYLRTVEQQGLDPALKKQLQTERSVIEHDLKTAREAARKLDPETRRAVDPTERELQALDRAMSKLQTHS